jgi:TolB-like protein
MNFNKRFISTCALLIVTAMLPAQNLPFSVAYMGTYAENQWHRTVTAPFVVQTFSGNMERGLILFGGNDSKQGAWIKDIINGSWQVVADAPFTIKKSAGDNQYGPIICGGISDRQVAYMRDYKANVWIAVKDAPFPIIDITGINFTGPLIAGGEKKNKVAFMRDYSVNEWKTVADAPFAITCLAGENLKGPVIAGGQDNRQVAYMSDLLQNTWTVLTDAPFPIFDLAGSNEKGPVIVGGQGAVQVAYMDDYKSNKWKIVTQSPLTAMGLTGTNDKGIILISSGSGAATTAGSPLNRKIRQKVLKAAVVEFSERGTLGIKDAGTIIAEWLTTALNKTGAFEVYERLSLASIMQEHQLSQSGALDDATIAQVGKMKGVEAIVTGSIIKFGDIISVTAKVVDVETAKILATADIKVNDINAISTEIEKLAWELARE